MKNHRISWTVVLLVLAGIFGYSMLVNAGEEETGSPFTAMQETLDAILETQDAMLEAIASSGEPEKEGYHHNFILGPLATDVIFTVPAEKVFVFRFVKIPSSSAFLTVDDEVFTSINQLAYLNTINGTNIPDICITIEEGSTLKAVNLNDGPWNIIIMGYFRDAQ